MARYGDPRDWRYVFIVGRSFKEWNQATMAQEAGIDPSQYCRYEQGERVPSPRIRKQIATALGVDASFLEWFLPRCRNIRLAFERAIGGAEEEGEREIGSLPQLHGEVTSAVVEAATPFLLELDHPGDGHVPSSQDRSWAEQVWERMKPLTGEDQALFVEILQDERSWALAERLCEESTAAAADRGVEALRLAQLAVHVADKCHGPESRRLHIRAYCQDFDANSIRVCGNLPAARAAFEKADELWKRSEGSDLANLLDANRRLDLKASLLRKEGQWVESLALLDSAMKNAKTGHARCRLLLMKATTFNQMGAYDQALSTLHQIKPLIELQSEQRLVFLHDFTLTVCLCHLGRYTDAEPLLGKIRALAGENELDRVRVRWLEGRIWEGLGSREDALAALSEVREYFQKEEIDYDFALVTLELAVLHLEEGRTARVRELAEEMLWIFQRQKVHKEALAALMLFRRAAQLEEAQAEWTRRLVQYLYRAEHNPGLRFEK